jgi:hypothetical protein
MPKAMAIRIKATNGCTFHFEMETISRRRKRSRIDKFRSIFKKGKEASKRKKDIVCTYPWTYLKIKSG